MRGALRVAVVPAVLMLASGCATKDFVRELVGKSEAELDQRVGKVGERVVAVEGRLGEESQRVTKVEGRLGGVETKVGEVGEQAKQAQTKADTAFNRADEVDSRLSRLWTNRHKRQLVETVHVQFAFDKADLTDGAQTALLTILKEMKANPALTLDLEGYTDPTGPARLQRHAQPAAGRGGAPLPGRAGRGDAARQLGGAGSDHRCQGRGSRQAAPRDRQDADRRRVSWSAAGAGLIPRPRRASPPQHSPDEPSAPRCHKQLDAGPRSTASGRSRSVR